MRFSSSVVLSVAALSAQVFSVSAAVIKRATTVAVLEQYISQANTAVSGDLVSLNNTVINSANDVNAQVEIIASASANLQDIGTELNNFATEIEATTAALATSLTTPEIVALTASFEAAADLFVTLYFTYNDAAEVLTADSVAAINSEAVAAAAAVKAFSAPLATYANQVQEIGASQGSSSVVALQAAAASVESASSSFSAAVGLS